MDLPDARARNRDPMSPLRRVTLSWTTLVALPLAFALLPGEAALAAKKGKPKPAISVSAKPSASAPKAAHSTVLAQLKKGLDLQEQGNKDLEAARDDATKANAALKAAHALITKGRKLVAEGERQQKLGRELKRKGRPSEGDAKIAAGMKTIDDGAREVNAGIAAVKSAQATLNAIHARIVKARAMVDDGKKIAKEAQTQL